MTTTRINHTGHNHPSTTAARTACRKAMKATPVIVSAPVFPTAMVGNGKAIHLAVMHDGSVLGVRCGSGLKRDGSDSTYRFNGNLPASDVTCRSCPAF